MLKELSYDGAYRDQSCSISVLLENPSDYGLKADMLAFSVTIIEKQEDTHRLEDFSFYIMDEQNRLYNTQQLLDVQLPEVFDEPLRKSEGLIFTEFNPEFLFQDLRIAFYSQQDQQFHIIAMKQA